jgi:dienelactone hydrolase
MSEVEVQDGVERHRFELRSRDDIVPGYLWTEMGGRGQRPLVLLGHGATASKDARLITALGQRLVTELGFTVAAIDFPNHGERRPEEERSVPAAHVRSAMGLVAWRQRNTQATEQAISDLRATLDFACERSDVNPDLAGYIGLSMGTRFGVPFVAAEPRVRAAVFGLFGWSPELRQPDEEGLAERSPAFASAARTVRAPALFLLQWDDELFPREDGLALYDLLGSPEKTLHANPGGHIALPRAEVAGIIEFVKRHLGGTAPR